MSSFARKDRTIQQRRHDAYAPSKGKAKAHVCPECGVLFESGRWFWGPIPDEMRTELCPACRRIRDRYPAGYVALSGDYLTIHREEIINLVKNVAESQQAEHPMERLMMLTDDGEVINITTTGVHLARRIGDALYSAWEGELAVQYGDDDNLIRVNWQRN